MLQSCDRILEHVICWAGTHGHLSEPMLMPRAGGFGYDWVCGRCIRTEQVPDMRYGVDNFICT